MFLRTLFILILLATSSISVAAQVLSPPATPPDSFPSAEAQVGITLYKEKRFDESRELFERALALNAADYDACYYLGLIHLQMKDLNKAIKSFEAAIAIKSDSFEAHAGLAYVLLLRSRIDDSIREAQSAMDINPSIADAQYIMGAAKLRKNLREEALTLAEKAISLNPKYAPAYLLKSQALASFQDNWLRTSQPDGKESRERCAQARDALAQYLKLEPNSEDNELWNKQLESLGFYAGLDKADPLRPRGPTETTTRVRILSKPEPSYTERARSNGLVGAVILRCVLDVDGTVKHILVVKGLPFGMTEASIAATRKIEFVPALMDGKPVSSFIQLEYNFNLY